jgi:hypothetical protein
VAPERYSSETFRVIVRPKPHVLADGADPEDHPELLVIDVPRDYYTEFQRDLPGALRDLAGEPV